MKTDAFAANPPPVGSSPSPAPAPAGTSPQANASPPVLNGTANGAPANPPPVGAGAVPASPPAQKPADTSKAAEHKAPASAEDAAKAEAQKQADAAAFAAKGDGKPVPDAPAKDGTPGVGDNSKALDAKKAELLDTVGKLGRARGQGANTRAELAVIVCQSARDGLIEIGKGKTDIADIYNAFRAGQVATQVDDRQELDAEGAEKKMRPNISKLAIFAKLGALQTGNADPTKMMITAREVVGTVKDGKMNTYDAMREVAGEFIKAFKADPKAKLFNKTKIKEIVTPDGPAEDTRSLLEYELDEVEAIHNRMVKLSGGTENRAPCESPQLTKAIEYLNGRKAELTKLVAAQSGQGEGNKDDE